MFIRKMAFYAVARGRAVGVYYTWSDCEQQVKNFKGAKYKKFNTFQEAAEYIRDNDGETAMSAATMPLKKFNPIGDAVPLGPLAGSTKIMKTNAGETKTTSNYNDFWPDSDDDGDSFNEDGGLTEEDLLYALAEVEGYPTEEQSNLPKRQKATLSKSNIAKFESKIWEPVCIKNICGFDFDFDEQGFVIVYTDGSCINNGGADAHAGFGVYFGRDHPLNVGKPVEGRVTNNVGEIQAVIHAIKTAKLLGICKLCINTDSQFLLNSAIYWIKSWKRKGWKLKNGGAVKNVDDFKVLDALLQDKEIEIKWNYVAAHCGIEGNEMADKLARDGSAEYKRLHKRTS